VYDAFVCDLETETKLDCGYSKEGLLALASTEDSAEIMRRRYEWQRKAGFDVHSISVEKVQTLEPLITAPIAAALLVPGGVSVAPRRPVSALRESCFNRGVELRPGLNVEEISPNRVRIGKMTLESADIVIASGVWSAELKGLNPPIPVY